MTKIFIKIKYSSFFIINCFFELLDWNISNFLPQFKSNFRFLTKHSKNSAFNELIKIIIMKEYVNSIFWFFKEYPLFAIGFFFSGYLIGATYF